MTAGPTARVGAIVLAAGRSSRMGGRNKLLEHVEGIPVVVRVVAAAVEGGAAPVVVVLGHQCDQVETAVRRDASRSAGSPAAGLTSVNAPIVKSAAGDVHVVYNPRWSEGMSTSIAVGLEALEGRVDSALICLGDMPRLMAADVAALLRAFRTHRESAELPAAFVPVFDGQRGNPVLWTKEWFGALRDLSGDRGAKALLDSLGARVVEVDAVSDGVLHDVDTPEALERERGR